MSDVNFVAPNLQQLITEWKKDSVINPTDAISNDLIQTPIIHSKYNKYLSMHKLASVKKNQELDSMIKNKWMWMNGKLSKDELDSFGWEPFLLTVLKPDQTMFLNADKDIQELKSKIAFHDECVSFCTNVMKELNSRTYQIRSFMDWERFIRGSN